MTLFVHKDIFLRRLEINFSGKEGKRGHREGKEGREIKTARDLLETIPQNCQISAEIILDFFHLCLRPLLV